MTSVVMEIAQELWGGAQEHFTVVAISCAVLGLLAAALLAGKTASERRADIARKADGDDKPATAMTEDEIADLARELWWPHHESSTRATALAELDRGGIGLVTLEFEDFVNLVKAVDRLRASQAGGVPAGAVCHDDQLGIWAEELLFALECWIEAPESYDDGVQCASAAKDEIKRIVTCAFALASPPPPATDGDALREALETLHAVIDFDQPWKPASDACKCVQHCNGGADAWNAALKKARNALASSPPLAATESGMGQSNNTALLLLSKVWQLDGDWMKCRSCKGGVA